MGGSKCKTSKSTVGDNRQLIMYEITQKESWFKITLFYLVSVVSVEI